MYMNVVLIEIQCYMMKSLMSMVSLDYYEHVVKSLNVCLFDLILYVPSTIFQLYRNMSS